MKVVALLCGLLASAFAWTAPYLLANLLDGFLALWPTTNSQQLLATLIWHGLVAAGLLGGLLTVLTPATGTLVLIGGAAGWAVIGLMLPTGFNLQVLVPLGLLLLGAVLAFGASIRAALRRREARRPPSLAELQREEALRLEPEVELRRAAELQGLDAPDIVDDGDEPLPAFDVRRPARRTIVEETAYRSGGSPIFVGLNVLVLVLLAGAVGALLYSEYRSGGLSAAFALPPPEQPAALAAAAQPQPEAEPEPAVAVAPRAPEEPTAPAEPEVRVSTTPLDLAELSTATYADPFEYCAAVGTIDAPDRRYTGPAAPPTLIVALGTASEERSGPPLAWRCLGGTLLACTAQNDAACAPTPSVADMIAYCSANPDARDLGAPGGSWSCRGTRPEIPLGQTWPVDARGFLPSAWTEVGAPAAAPAG